MILIIINASLNDYINAGLSSQVRKLEKSALEKTCTSVLLTLHAYAYIYIFYTVAIYDRYITLQQS